MNLWLDAHLPAAVAPWISARFAVAAVPVRDLRLRDAGDRAIFLAARMAGPVVITKDSDFVKLLQELGPPPQVIWLTFGNTSNAGLRDIFAQTLDKSFDYTQSGESLIEISG
jgi:predicted nuclease of predicted toxin-antitoxin system